MARKDIFDRIDTKMRSQLQTLGKSPRRETDEQDFVEKRVSKRVIRRRARKPRKGEAAAAAEAAEAAAAEATAESAEEAALAAAEEPAAETAEELLAGDTGADGAEDAEPTAAAEAEDAEETPEEAAEPEPDGEPAAAGAEDAGPTETADQAEEPAAEADGPVPGEEPPSGDGEPAEEPEAAALAEDEPAAAEDAGPSPEEEPPASEPEPETTGAEEPQAGESDDADQDEARSTAVADDAVDADADAEDAGAAEPGEDPAAGGAVGADEPAAAAAAEPATEPGELSETQKKVAEDPAAPSLEELLREQGIVQHKPKKGRRIITDAPVTERKPIPKPVIRHDIAAQAAMRQARQAGYGAEAPAPGQPRDGSRRRGASPPERLEREMRKEREREQRMHRTKKRGRRKSIVQRPDMMYYPDRRTTRKKGGAAGPRSVSTVQPKESKRVIRIENEISVGELAKELGLKAPELIRKFIELGQMVTVNQFVDFETATLVAAEFGYRVEDIGFKEEDVIEEIEDDEADMVGRPPVITVMGHVDHGKTSILDSIRKTRVAAGEAGGITQHIGAYQVEAGGQLLTFLDTPGHEAFTAMRARGAEATDLVVLVVAANDGVMPQTIESINHTRAAGVPILVAINKIDIPNANIDRVKQELSDQDLVPEDWGGDTVMVPVSATKGTGIKDLLEMIALQAEMLELRANPERAARGLVIEANLSKGVGPVATVLVQHGTLRVGDYVVAGTAYGRVRAMMDHAGKRIQEATPSTPAEIHGLSEVPEAGDEVAVVEDERAAKTLIEHRTAEARDKALAKSSRVTMDTLTEVLAASALKELNIVLKADVHGSVEALREALLKIEVEETTLKILHAAVGGINHHDVMLAAASGGLVVGFNVRPDANAQRAADEQGVQIRTYRVIYECLEEIQGLLTGLLEPIYEEEVHGAAEVRETFKIPKVGAIAGCMVSNGEVARNHKARLLRDGVVIWEGKMSSLKRFKDDVKEVKEGYECGIGLHEYNDIKKGDVIETYTMKEVARGA